MSALQLALFLAIIFPVVLLSMIFIVAGLKKLFRVRKTHAGYDSGSTDSGYISYDAGPNSSDCASAGDGGGDCGSGD